MKSSTNKTYQGLSKNNSKMFGRTDIFGKPKQSRESFRFIIGVTIPFHEPLHNSDRTASGALQSTLLHTYTLPHAE